MTGDRRPGSAPRVIAHRGGAARAPENSGAAFRAAAGAGFGFELDARLCATGELVVVHDERLGRTNDGSGLVAESSLAILAGLDAGGWFAPEFRGERIETLGDVLRRHASEVLILVELKSEARDAEEARALARAAVATIRSADAVGRIVAASFDARVMAAVRELEPAIARAQILGELPSPIVDPAVAPSHMMLRADLIDPDLVGSLHDAGQMVYAWTVNTPGEVRRLVAAAVDGIISDDPWMVRHELEAATASAEVEAVLTAQIRAWNRGDLDTFCTVYADDARFLSPSGVRQGRAEVLARYRESYPDRAAMGTLSLEILEIRPAQGTGISLLGDAVPGGVHGASVAARWHLAYPGAPAKSGLTLIVLHRIAGTWRIVEDASM